MILLSLWYYLSSNVASQSDLIAIVSIICFFYFLIQEFDDYRDADDACHELNGRDFLGARIVVEHARGPRRDRDRDGKFFTNVT